MWAAAGGFHVSVSRMITCMDVMRRTIHTEPCSVEGRTFKEQKNNQSLKGPTYTRDALTQGTSRRRFGPGHLEG